MDRNILRARIENEDPEAEKRLFRAADRCRAARVGDGVHLRGIIEFSSFCRRNCLYCGLRADNRALGRYRLEEGKIVALAQECRALEIPTVVLQSGEDPEYGPERICRLVERIKSGTGLAVTVSAGEMTRADYRRLREAGADRYLLKIETSDPALYAKLRPGCRFEDRRDCLEWLGEAGFQVGSGNMVGLPGQTDDSLAGDLLFLRETGLGMVSVGPFLAHPDTPLAGTPPPGLAKVLRVLALARLLNPAAHMPATTSIGTLDPEGRQRALECGANVVMPNLSPLECKPLYQIYPGKICLDEQASKCRSCLGSMIAGIGRSIATGPGHALARRAGSR